MTVRQLYVLKERERKEKNTPNNLIIYIIKSADSSLYL